jgi:hypothetical protein
VEVPISKLFGTAGPLVINITSMMRPEIQPIMVQNQALMPI